MRSAQYCIGKSSSFVKCIKKVDFFNARDRAKVDGLVITNDTVSAWMSVQGPMLAPRCPFRALTIRRLLQGKFPPQIGSKLHAA
jgi:hypothetical protein